MLTRHGKLGLRALLSLATLDAGRWATAAELAADLAAPRGALDAVLRDLRSGGFVATRTARGGGYRLLRPAGEVMVGHALRVVNGPLAPIACASRSAHAPCNDCPDEATCAIRALMLDVRNAIAGVLDATSLADLAPAPEPAEARG
ncbi:Rrf2 family transcriptional regulator [Amaricoccus sp.]|uniref:RrF2 family transcriptional regulator n=1 Tax=Amaricoccus sp. TaxID=1872485 RepID=UPI001B6093D0|nr:Rrf2 family transcriptional regulator [Amaricoccus sp.]MBP7002382.1 Rrf2 family transcriptional regulator [Amaricoccus sp.]